MQPLQIHVLRESSICALIHYDNSQHKEVILVYKKFTTNTQSAYREMMIHRQASRMCSGVVKFISEHVVDGALGFLMEACKRESLQMMIENQQLPRDEASIRLIALHMFKTVDKLHRAFIVHLNLEPGNWLLMRDGDLKLTDFGSAEYVRCEAPSNDFEDRYSDPRNKFREDLYQLGKTLYEVVLLKKYRYHKEVAIDVLQVTIRDKFKKGNHSEVLADVVLGLLVESKNLGHWMSVLKNKPISRSQS